MMGSPASEMERADWEGPQHQVTVSSFYMGKYEVTQKEWVEIMGSNPSRFKGDNLPVENVGWYDAVEYCNA
jgi:formylglycine-generating enzyme required for sulfatase activity